jgi:hypothetical protein
MKTAVEAVSNLVAKQILVGRRDDSADPAAPKLASENLVIASCAGLEAQAFDLQRIRCLDPLDKHLSMRGASG